MPDAEGNQLPYLDRIEFRVIEDGVTAGEALRERRDRHLLHVDGHVIADFQETAATSRSASRTS